MKKLFKYIPLSALLLPATAYAAGCDNKLNAVGSLFSFNQVCTVNDFVIKVISFLLSIIAVISALMIIWGGYRIVTSAGNEDGVKKGRKTITYAVIGLAVAVLAYTIIAVVNHTLAANG